jgi:hypothetical protein
VTVDLVLLRLTVPLPLVVFGSVLVGMLAVLLVGLKADLQTRRAIQRFREVATASKPSSRVSELPVSETLISEPRAPGTDRPDEALTAESQRSSAHQP